MISDSPSPWEQDGARATLRAEQPGVFVAQHLSPLFFKNTEAPSTSRRDKEFVSEADFWKKSEQAAFGVVRLKGFKITDWFPRAPGVFWSERARIAIESVYASEPKHDAQLGNFYSPQSKMNLIENGGIGTIRLRPRQIDGVYCSLATALTGINCHTGIPLAIPETPLLSSGLKWGDKADLVGRVRFLQDAGLADVANSIQGARPLILFVESLVTIRQSKLGRQKLVITPVVLFEIQASYDRPGYTFVQCSAGADADLDRATQWIELYTSKHSGQVITNFDEQRPILADAPLSYQRLVAKTYDKTIVQRFTGTMAVQRIDKLVHEENKFTFGDINMGHNINVSGPAIVAIDSTLNNVSQTISTADGLSTVQKSQLEEMVKALRTELDGLKATHPDETREIADAVQKAVATASKPPEERKKSLLQLSANGLKEAAELVKDIAPNVLTTAGLIAKFVVGL
jgi:hypothetical protein